MSTNKIKNFFSRKKEEAKFKLNLGGGSLGQGHKLNAETPVPSSSKKPVKDVYIPPPKRNDLSEEAKSAAAAALARVEKKSQKDFNTSLAAIKAQAKRELEAERKLKEQFDPAKSDIKKYEGSSNETNKDVPVTGVLFRCSLISDEILPKADWKIKIHEFLYQQIESEPGLTACLIIYNCNVKEKIAPCVETLCKYLENVINNPNEEKYLKIRMNNRIFAERVRYVEGAMEFLKASGFKEQEIDNEMFLIWSAENVNPKSDLQTLLDGLRNAEIIHLELDRNIQVLMPSQTRKVEIPPDFFRVCPEEIKREQQIRTSAIEEAHILKTKAMREREEKRVLNLYRYSLIRVRFPDGICLQGTFNVYEKISDVYDFVQSCLNVESLEFNLYTNTLGILNDSYWNKSLYDLRLVPNAVLIFEPVAKTDSDTYIKDKLLLLIKPM